MKKSDSKLKEERDDRMWLYFSYVCVLIGIIGLIYSTSLFWIGFHNTDLGYNMAQLEAATGTEWLDLTNKGNYKSHMEMYMMGTSQQQQAYVLGLFFTFFLITYLIELMNQTAAVAKQ